MSRGTTFLFTALLVVVGLPSGVLGEESPARGRTYQDRTYVEWRTALVDRSPQIRVGAVHALRHFGRDAMQDLTSALKDVDAGVRTTAAWALGQMTPASPEAVWGLAQAVSDLDVGVRQMVVWALANQGPAAADAVPELIRALRDSNNVVRATAAQALGAIGPAAKAAAIPMVQAMQGAHSYIYNNLVSALRKIGPAVIEELRRSAERDPELQALLERALVVLGAR
jgi:HEAT repeat protein